MPDAVHKPRRPPTFHHYPANRAKKLKKEWVETAKIKSKWKAQKRREGIVSLRSGHKGRQVNEDEGDKGSEGSGHSDSEPASDASLNKRTDTPSDSSSDHDSPKVSQPPPRSPKPQPPNKQNKKHPLPRNNNKNSDNGDATTQSDDKSSLRDLFQKAYSKSSLHTYKSDPFKRGRSYRDRGRGSGRGGRGGAAPTRGRGQPNMKLRMNAMLAKITEQTRNDPAVEKSLQDHPHGHALP